MKKKKFLATTLMASILTIGSLVPVSAAGNVNNGSTGINGNTGNSTKVEVQVVDDLSQIGQVSVTVPTVLAIAVYANQAQTEQENMPTAYVSDLDSNAIRPGTGNMTFINRSTAFNTNGDKETVPVYLRGVTTESKGDWALKKADPTDTDAKTLQIKLGSGANVKTLEDTAKGASVETDLGLMELKASTLTAGDLNINEVKTAIPVEVAVGGKNKEYKKENSSTAFTLQWHITKDAPANP